jgi:hypothetical protein
MKEIKKITIALTSNILKQLEEGNYNRSKLIDSLLTEHFKNQKKNANKINTRRVYIITQISTWR